MLTKFGKQLRKIRIEGDEILKDMADKLGVTVAYLSAVENGKRAVPDSWVHIIVDKYGLDEEAEFELQKSAYENKTEIKISLEDEKKSDLALSFARKFKDLTDEEVKRIQNLLDSI